MERTEVKPDFFRRVFSSLGFSRTSQVDPPIDPPAPRVDPPAKRTRRQRAVSADWVAPEAVASFDVSELRQLVHNDLASAYRRARQSADPRAKVDREFMARLARIVASETLELPVFPKASRELDQLLRDGDPDHQKVVDLLSREPDLLRRVWQRANCALYRVPVTDLDRAISRLGYDEVWRIGMSACLQSEVFRAGPYAERVEAMRSMGLVAGRLAGWIEGSPRGEGYLAGLLHQVGGMYILRIASLDRMHRPSDACIAAVLQRHQTAIAVIMCTVWGLGSNVSAGVGAFSRPVAAPLEARPFVTSVRDGVLGAVVGRQILNGTFSETHHRLLVTARTEQGDAEKIVKRSKRFWMAEQDGVGDPGGAETARAAS